jgi:polygalacturonase
MKNQPALAPVVDAGAPKLYVTKGVQSPDANRTHATLRAALAAAQPGTKIVLLDEALDEPAISTLSSKPKEGLTDCTIESGSPSKTTTWKVSANSPSASSALEFQGLSGLTLSGLTIDCNRQCRFGVSILGLCPGLTLKNVTIKNCEMAGVRIDNAGGDPGKPIRLDGVRVSATSDKPLMAGVLITASPTLPNKSIQIANSRFDGPGTDGVRIAGPLNDVEIVNNRFGVWQNGLTFSSGMPADATCKLTLASNTFFQFEHGIRCDVAMPKTVKGDVVIRQNLFVTGQTVSQGPSGAIVGLSASDNARDKATALGKTLDIPADEIAGQLPIDPANDATYLKGAKDSPFATFGPKQVPVGARD